MLILPGIMGSKLGKPGVLFDDTIWIDPVDIIAGNLRQLSLVGGRKDIEPLGVLLLAYLKLKLRLKLAGFDATSTPSTGARASCNLGRELAKRIRQETGADAGREDLYLVAHSMGGLVSRAACKQLKDKGEETKVRRLVMLGTPNFGSFAPVQALSGSSFARQERRRARHPPTARKISSTRSSIPSPASTRCCRRPRSFPGWTSTARPPGLPSAWGRDPRCWRRRPKCTRLWSRETTGSP